jgi:hypothetical protein
MFSNALYEIELFPRMKLAGMSPRCSQSGGRFAGLIRRLPAEERAQYQEIKAKQGLKAAIDALQKRRGSSS